jgi:hypothetical protein
MEFYINHTHKQIAFAGNNAHLNKFLETLSELVETKNWALKDDVQLFLLDVDSCITRETIRTLLEQKQYTLLDEEFWTVFFPEDEDLAQRMEDAYDEEVRREIERDNNTYGDDGRGWSGWETPGATCDV